jgi:tetratricopeptide (TPR) repeat protein
MDELLADAGRMRDRGEIRASMAMARRALALDPSSAEALEFLATALITRRRSYAEGLSLLDRAVVARAADPGIWYARGWCYEFAAHELSRRPRDSELDPRALYETAADSFRRCLSLHPEGKLLDDAGDLLDHVENVLEG